MGRAPLLHATRNRLEIIRKYVRCGAWDMDCGAERLVAAEVLQSFTQANSEGGMDDQTGKVRAA